MQHVQYLTWQKRKKSSFQSVRCPFLIFIRYVIREIGHEATINSLKCLCECISILSVDSHTVEKALSSDVKDYEDAIQYFSAMQDSTIDGIITRNPKDFKDALIPIISPLSFL